VFSNEPGRAVVLNQNGTINGVGQPARRGDVVVFYATGEGLTNPTTLTGERAPGDPLRRPVLPVSVLIGGVPVTQEQIVFAGSAPGFAGLMQVNVFIPLNAQLGNNVSLTLIVGSNSSQGGVGLTIQ
jgi:uncharacterized protein (TIGR03437 family)